MLKKIRNFLGLDTALSLKDNIALYMILSPLLLALGARAFVPTLHNIQSTVAIEQSLDPRVRNEFTNYMRVEVLPDSQAVIRRVEKPDDIPGIILREGQPVVVLEGNEQGMTVQGFAMMADHIIQGPYVSRFEETILPGKKIPIAEYITISLIMLGILLGSLVAGFNIVHEREKGAIKALTVAPLKFSLYILSRGIFSLLTGLIISLGSALIMMGTQAPFISILLTSCAGVGVIITVGLLIGGLASNQVQALGVIKILMTVFLSLPVISIFIPQKWHFVFYPLPNYWLFRAYESGIMGDFRGISYPVELLILGGSSVVLLLILGPFIRKKLHFR